MTTTTKPNPKPAQTQDVGDPLPYVPPEEKFWRNYSYHGEFPISVLASPAVHIIIFGAIIFILASRLDNRTNSEVPPVPIRGLQISDGNRGDVEGGAGGGQTGDNMQEVPQENPMNSPRDIPQAELDQRRVSASAWVPSLKENPADLNQIIQSPRFDALGKLNDAAKQIVARGFKGAGTGSGNGAGNSTGSGPGGEKGNGNASSSGSRSVRWTINFKTNSGRDYVAQLAAFKAILLVPQPPDWKTNVMFDDLNDPKPKSPNGKDFPGMNFIDENPASAAKVAQALGLDYAPPNFVAFFPKSVEEELAAKERAYRNRAEQDIYSTTFQVLLRNNQFVISVTDQVPQKK